MKKLFYSAAFCAATLLGFSSCSSDPVMPEPVNPAVGVIGGEEVNLATPWIEGPTNILLDRLYTFTAKSNLSNDTFTFTVEDTYFHDPRSYGINVSPSGVRINVVFNDYGHYKITAKSKITGLECSYEVAKYYKEIGPLRYYSNAPGLRDGMEGANFQISRRLQPTTLKGFTQRVVVNTVEYFMEYWYPYRGTPYMKRGFDNGTITGTAAKGAYSISLPDGQVRTHPEYDPVAMNNMALFVPFCEQEVTIPEERCGAL